MIKVDAKKYEVESLNIDKKINMRIALNSLAIRPIYSLNSQLDQKFEYVTLEMIPEEKVLLCYRNLINPL